MVALTHMRGPNDRRLAEQATGIDLILGGHDHDYFSEKVCITLKQYFHIQLYLNHQKNYNKIIIRTDCPFESKFVFQLCITCWPGEWSWWLPQGVRLYQ